MQKYLLSFALFVLVYTAQAQVRFAIGPQAGYTLATARYTQSAYAINTRYRSGFAAGVLAEVGLGHLSVRPAALFAQKGIDFMISYVPVTGPNDNYTDSRNRINYLVSPLTIGYTQHRDGQGVQVVGGAYFGFALGGHYTDDYTYSLPSGGTLRQTVDGNIITNGSNSTASNDRRVRPGDFGVQAGIGYRYQGLLAQAEYSWGLRNVDPNSTSNPYNGYPAYYNRGFQFSLAYLFGPKS